MALVIGLVSIFPANAQDQLPEKLSPMSRAKRNPAYRPDGNPPLKKIIQPAPQATEARPNPVSPVPFPGG